MSGIFWMAISTLKKVILRTACCCQKCKPENMIFFCKLILIFSNRVILEFIFNSHLNASLSSRFHSMFIDPALSSICRWEKRNKNVHVILLLSLNFSRLCSVLHLNDILREEMWSKKDRDAVNFIKVFLRIFRKNVVFYVHVTRKKLPKWRFVRKTSVYNVDEIET